MVGIGRLMAEENIDELFAATLSGGYDDEAPWEAVSALRRIGTRPVFDRAAEWCRSDDPLKRARAASVLAQLGKTNEHRENSFPAESYALLVKLVETESDPQPLASGVHALGHLDNPEAVPLITRFHAHPHADVRYAVACALGNYPNHRLSVANLLELTRDPDADVRDWATFGVGVLEPPTMSDRVVEAAYLMLGMESEPESWAARDYVSELRRRFF